MTFATLLLALFTTFFSILLEALLIPDLSVSGCMAQVDVSICCGNRLMNIRDTCFTWSLSPSTWSGVLRRVFSAMALVMAGHTSCRPKFLHHTCQDIRWNHLRTLQKALHDIYAMSNRKLHRTTIRWSTKCQGTCSGAQNKLLCAMCNISRRSSLETDQQGQGELQKVSFSGWRTSSSSGTLQLTTR